MPYIHNMLCENVEFGVKSPIALRMPFCRTPFAEWCDHIAISLPREFDTIFGSGKKQAFCKEFAIPHISITLTQALAGCFTMWNSRGRIPLAFLPDQSLTKLNFYSVVLVVGFPLATLLNNTTFPPFYSFLYTSQFVLLQESQELCLSSSAEVWACTHRNIITVDLRSSWANQRMSSGLHVHVQRASGSALMVGYVAYIRLSDTVNYCERGSNLPR